MTKIDPVKYRAMPFDYKIARFSLLLRKAYPFLGELCLRVGKYRKELQGLAATDGLNLYLNVEKLNELPEESLNFVLLHELLHIILRHSFPKDSLFFEKPYWNIGFDLTANWLIMNMERELKQRELPVIPVSGTVLSADDLSGDPSHRIVGAFLEQAKQQGILSENPPSLIEIVWKSFKGIVQNSSFIFDILDKSDGTAKPPTDAEIQALLADCAKTAGKGGLPQSLQHLMNELTDGRTLPWFLILKRYLESGNSSEDLDFCLPDKRMLYSGMILPGDVNGDEILNNALIVLDVSGSVEKEELLSQIWQVQSILTELDFNGSIISFGSEVYQEAKLTNKLSLKKFIDGLEVGGGTDWANAVKYINEKKRNVKPIIVFTDGYFYSHDTGLSNLIFITQGTAPKELQALGKVIQINNK
jgi:predicted metal-dependent peptidase